MRTRPILLHPTAGQHTHTPPPPAASSLLLSPDSCFLSCLCPSGVSPVRVSRLSVGGLHSGPPGGSTAGSLSNGEQNEENSLSGLSGHQCYSMGPGGPRSNGPVCVDTDQSPWKCLTFLCLCMSSDKVELTSNSPETGGGSVVHQTPPPTSPSGRSLAADGTRSSSSPPPGQDVPGQVHPAEPGPSSSSSSSTEPVNNSSLPAG